MLNISLIERRRRLPSVNEADGEEDGWAMVRKFREKTRVDSNCGVGKDI